MKSHPLVACHRDLLLAGQVADSPSSIFRFASNKVGFCACIEVRIVVLFTAHIEAVGLLLEWKNVDLVVKMMSV